MQSPILRLPKKIKCLLFFLLIKIDQDDTVSRYYWSHHKTIKNSHSLLGSRKKKVLLLMAGPLRKLFFYHFFQRSRISTAIKLEGGGGLGLNGPAIKRKTFFCGFPKFCNYFLRFKNLMYSGNLKFFFKQLLPI